MFRCSVLEYYEYYVKENQQLKYLNKGSQHTEKCHSAIPKGVLMRLGKLTTINNEIANKTIYEVYPAHAMKRLKSLKARKPEKFSEKSKKRVS